MMPSTSPLAMHKLSADIIASVITLIRSRKSYREIRRQTGVSLGSISQIRSEHCSEVPKAVGGQPAHLSPTASRHAVRLCTYGKGAKTIRAASTLSKVYKRTIRPWTVRRALKRQGLKAVVKRKRPLLLPRHRKERMHFAERHLHWTVEDWKRVIYSDETKINRLGSDGRDWVWKRPGEGLSDRMVKSTLKFGGGSIMLWGCMLWEGAGFATRIEGKMDAKLYTAILEDELQQTLEYYGKTPQDIIFQQDNDPKHTSKLAQKWLKDHRFTVMIWPAQSPDINPIEHLWVHIKAKLAEFEYPPKGIQELWERVQKLWDEIPASVCQNLIESMPRRVEALYKAKGRHTKY
jgi:transposase